MSPSRKAASVHDAPPDAPPRDAGSIPNSRLPVLIYHDLDGARAGQECAELFAHNGWLGARVDAGSSPSTTSTPPRTRCSASSPAPPLVILGGPSARRFDVETGDVLVLAAGIGHCDAGSSADLLVVGSYPNGMRWAWVEAEAELTRECQSVLVLLAMDAAGDLLVPADRYRDVVLGH